MLQRHFYDKLEASAPREAFQGSEHKFRLHVHHVDIFPKAFVVQRPNQQMTQILCL
jgi:cytochrome oxidase assembly protein ShyY1